VIVYAPAALGWHLLQVPKDRAKDDLWSVIVVAVWWDARAA